jgi:hypothetical protein
MTKHLYLFSFFVLITISVWGQSLELSVLTSDGDFVSGKSATLSWTLGEIVIETYAAEDHYLTQGFQQPFYELMTSLEPETEEFNVHIYPNPATDHVYIDITMGTRLSCYHVEMIDLTGETVYRSELLCDPFHQSISLAHVSSSLVLIRITGESGEILKKGKIIRLCN